MTQEELKQLKELPKKARKIIPAQEIYVDEVDGVFSLRGFSGYILNGTITQYEEGKEPQESVVY